MSFAGFSLCFGELTILLLGYIIKNTKGVFKMADHKVKFSNNKPELYIDGKAVAPVIYGLSDFPAARSNTAYAQKNIAQFGEAGVNIVSCDSSLCLGWRKAEEFDPEPILAEIGGVLDANPNAKINIRLHMNPPYWWLRDNPDECIIYRTKEGDFEGIDNGEQSRLIANDGNKHLRVSNASKKWLKESTEKLVLFLKALEGTPEGEALMSVQFAYGKNGEWHNFGTDVSAPMKEFFKEYLKEKYKTEDALKAAWNDSEVTFDTAEFHPETFQKGDDGLYRDPRLSMRIIDSQHALQASVTNAILYFCRATKEVCPTRLCGAFYGYFLGTGGSNMTIGGHLDVKKVHSAPELDFLAGPFCYLDQRLPEGITIQRALLESCRLNGKLWLTEMDQAPYGTNNFVGGDPEMFPESFATMRRNVFQPLFYGQGFWFYDHRLVLSMGWWKEVRNPKAGNIYRKVGWWDAPHMMAEIKDLKAFADKISEKPYTTDTDLLIVYDADSYYVRAGVYDYDHKVHDAFARAGAAFDCIYLKDLEKADLDRYKAIAFVNCHIVTPEKRAFINGLKKDKMCIFLGGYGYCDGNTLDIKHTNDLLGMNMGKTDAALLKNNEEDIEIPEGYRPLFCVEDDTASPIAFFDNGRVAAAEKDNSVFYAMPYLDKVTAKELLMKAGVHLWTDSGEPVNVGYGYAAINCQRAGERKFFLKNGKEITIKTEDFKTILINLDSGEIM